MAELALDHIQGHALARHLDGVGMAELVGTKRRRTAARSAMWRNCVRAAAADQDRPAVGPLITQRSAPTGSCGLNPSQGSS